MMWFFLLLYVAHIAPVILQDDGDMVILKNGRDPCEGHVEVFHNKEWGYVGDTGWTDKTSEAVCRSTHCGEHVSTGDVLLRTEKKVWLNEIDCTKKPDDVDLLNCDYPGWGNNIYRKDLKWIKCSKRINISLSHFRCAGAVVYDSEEGEGYFCGDLESEEADMLCKSLGCGTSKKTKNEWAPKGKQKMSIRCLDVKNLDNLWQCASPTTTCTKPASVTCTDHKRLQIRGTKENVCKGWLEIEEDEKWKKMEKTDMDPKDLCKNMYCGEKGNHTVEKKGIKLTCENKVAVVLMDNTKKPSNCYGEVHMQVNGKNQPVCGTNWNIKNAELVCKELKCGKVLDHQTKRSSTQGIMDNVECSGKESSLWHCMAKRHSDTSNTFSCTSRAYVVCEGSIDVRLADGPGKCAGRVELLYEGQWQGVIKRTDENADAVCKHLKCGNQRKTAKPEKFSQGSGGSLDLSCKSSVSLSECDITKNKDFDRTETKEAVGITCEEHKVVFLKDNACSGMVGIQHGSETYWLSGSNDTWNEKSADTVCRQMHCGNAINHNYIPSGELMKDVWHESYNCSSSSTSLFECKITTRPSDHNETVATVRCSGDISVNLTEECWGYVNVCAEGTCDGVCDATWTDEMSQMLCKNLNCSKAMTGVKDELERNVIFKSLHMTKHTTKLNQCNLVKKKDRVSCKKAFVVCTGSVRANITFPSSRSKCSGKVEMSYKGRWLSVCKDALNNPETQNIICGELNCGRALKVDDYIGSRAAELSAAVSPVISKIECPTNGKMSECSISSDTSPCTLGHLQCSSWSYVGLKFGKACDGAVFVDSEGNTSAVSLTVTASKQLCKDLRCGELKSNKTDVSRMPSLGYRNFNCDGVEAQNIWDCEKETSLTKHSQDELVFIECEGVPNITLSNKCYGEVKINNISVCQSNWKPEYSEMACQELHCGKAVVNSNKASSHNVDGYHVSCEKYHHSLGQCNRYEDKCKKLAYVYCSGAVTFTTTEKCGGHIKVKYGGKKEEEFLCPTGLSSDMKKKLCEKMDCGGHNHTIRENNKKAKLDIKAQLNCTKDHRSIERCISISIKEALCKEQPAMIYCNEYENETVVGPEPEPNHTVPIILGIGFLLIVVILIIVFIRIRTVRNAKRPMNVSSRMLPGNEVESESGEYEPVTNKENEMDVFSDSRFRSEAEVITEGDARSASSYDDVDEAAESQPLTSPTTPAGASGDNFFGDGALHQSSDGVTYEVEDPQENYDDIEASPEIIQTKAEVHDAPEPTPESVTVATPGIVQREEDYLVPGQDR